jgi:2-keto-4-pentenoate hydratase/2-oxohepta-3-ene-1,7-dioic acid hydratase in catechol pathway
MGPGDLKIEVYVNGKLRQCGTTKDFIFGINKLISFVLSVMTLLPGDIIATGTPPGSEQIKPGDVVEVKIDKIGVLNNYVVGSN